MQVDSKISGASSSLSTISPSFNLYSSKNLADIAARVLHELNLSHDDHLDDFLDSSSHVHQIDAVLTNNIDSNNNDNEEEEEEEGDDVESEFTFAILCEEDTSSSIITADDIFHNGQIKPIYPFFTQNDDVSERNDSVSSSSSEGGEVKGIPQGAYCVWTPKKEEEKEKEIIALKKKSKSTGTSSPKRWRLMDLVHRSNSDGKDTFVFLNSNNSGGGRVKRTEKVNAVNGGYYGHNKGGKKMEEMKKKTYLPYRQDLVGLFSTVNGFSRTVHPF